MSYATVEQVIERHGAEAVLLLADRDGDGAADAGFPPAASLVLERALSDAAAEIDTYLAAKYDLPLFSPPASPPEVLTRLAVDIAVYRLAAEADLATDERRRRYEDAVALLRRIGRGEASLGLASPGAPSRAMSMSGRRRFTRGSMAGVSGGSRPEWD